MQIPALSQRSRDSLTLAPKDEDKVPACKHKNHRSGFVLKAQIDFKPLTPIAIIQDWPTTTYFFDYSSN